MSKLSYIYGRLWCLTILLSIDGDDPKRRSEYIGRQKELLDELEMAILTVRVDDE